MTTVPDKERLLAQVGFAVEIDKLKRVLRRNTLMDGSRRENDAEHSWHLGMLAMVLGEHAPPGTDLGRVTAMLLVHDIVEIDAGDTFVYDVAAVEVQRKAERAAADRIFGLLPADQTVTLRALWDEFEERVTPEARFARALDRLAPMLANHHTEGGSWVRHGVTIEEVMEKVEIIREGSPALGAYATEIVELSAARGHLARGHA
ncbi:hydrolase [Sphaerisporangium krabiense]|uniref:Putative hydrolase of HD superfamily n=1 Tax=Sphaerisporangium krabiense TaxID=763782 RepID=A0A7W9DNL1_9ACTN|nr:HD domain-containing protein [Sphaerisporangium krabiense]MBB5625551.1 putative hydrolase of HD superfamily [Sphaerisporangium krabiense]GII63119.1 hydrolase [Sphaerisporangium krabiense]